MITASELGMLCAQHRIKNASWLTEGARSWFTPKPPEMNLTKDQKPQAQPNPYAKASEQPFGATKGLPKGLPKGNPIQPVQTAAKPQFDYVRPPGQNVKTQITPYEHFKPLYKDYPGGYQGAIDDSQRYQNDAKLERLPTWKPEDLQKPVQVYTGNYGLAHENRVDDTTGFAAGSPAGGYQAGRRHVGNVEIPSSMPGSFLFPRRNTIVTNPNLSPQSKGKEWWKSMFGHELTHATHNEESKNSREPSGVFAGHENSFKDNPTATQNAGVGNKRTGLQYYGKPTEFGAYLSELRRNWIENNPGKRLNNASTAETLLQHYNPAREVEPGSRFDVTVPDAVINNNVTYDSAYPRSRASENDAFKTMKPKERAWHTQYLQRLYNQEQRAFQARKASGEPDGYRKIDIEQIEQPVPNITPFQRLLPEIMSNPELKRKAITAILSSVVQNKQRQIPGTNV